MLRYALLLTTSQKKAQKKITITEEDQDFFIITSIKVGAPKFKYNILSKLLYIDCHFANVILF